MALDLKDSLESIQGGINPKQHRIYKLREKANRLLTDVNLKICIAFFAVAIILLIAYQVWWAARPLKAFMLEPDSYEYALFLAQAIKLHSINISNPYLVYPQSGFFEAGGLYLVPLAFHYLLPFLPIPWDFRIPYILAVACIYIVSLLVLKRILNSLPINRSHRYLGYGLLLMGYLILSATELVEWRGIIFIAAFQLLMYYIICLAFLDWPRWDIYKKSLAFISIPFLLLLSWFMWASWYINLICLLLIPFLFIYRYIRGNGIHRIGAVAIMVIAISIVFFSVPMIALIIQASHTVVSSSNWCLYNPVELGEVQCLNASDGLYTVALYLAFLAFAIWMLLNDSVFSKDRGKYDYLIAGLCFMAIMQLPLAMVYIRALQLIGPYITIGFILGLISFFIKNARMGVNRFVVLAITIGIVLSSIFGFLTFWSTTGTVYKLDNPIGLVQVANYLQMNAPSNSTVLSFYAYGDYLEYSGHVRVYSDTIQELNISNIISQDSFYSSNPVNCSYLAKLLPAPNYVLAPNRLADFNLFVNAPNQSIANDPMMVQRCGYSFIGNFSGFYLFKRPV